MPMYGRATGWGACLWVIVNVSAQAMPVTQDCTRITSSLKRLECFDVAAGTPARTLPVQAQPFVATVLPIVDLVQRNEARRTPGDFRFLISFWPEPHDESEQRVVISAPALGAFAPRPYLVISCESAITRLQLVLDQPATPNKIDVVLLKDKHPVSRSTWQVMDDAGLVVEFSRGLPTIAVLRELFGSKRLTLESPHYAPIDGLVFDAEGLDELIKQERQACHW